MNIQFGKNKNNTNKVKKIYNKGNIITVRPQTAKYPYKILSIKEYSKPSQNNIKNLKYNNIFKCYNNSFRKSFSFVDYSQRNIYRKKEVKDKNFFNYSSFENNEVLSTYNSKKKEYSDHMMFRLFSANNKKHSNSINNNFNKISLIKNRKLLIKRGSYSMNKNNKSLNLNSKENINSIIQKNKNYKIKQFISDNMNNDNLKNTNYNTTNNIANNDNKNKFSKRNIIIQRHYNIAKQNKISLSYTKNKVNELKPIIINIKENFDCIPGEKAGEKENHKSNNNFLQFIKKLENELKIKSNKSSKIQTIRAKTSNNICVNKSLNVGKRKKIIKRKIKKEEIKNDFNDSKNKNKINKDKSKEKWNKNNFIVKKKSRLNKDIKIKQRKRKIFNNKIENEFLRYANNFKMGKFHYLNNSKNYLGLEYEKNSDIYNYLVSPKNSDGITDEINKNNI